MNVLLFLVSCNLSLFYPSLSSYYSSVFFACCLSNRDLVLYPFEFHLFFYIPRQSIFRSTFYLLIFKILSPFSCLNAFSHRPYKFIVFPLWIGQHLYRLRVCHLTALVVGPFLCPSSRLLKSLISSEQKHVEVLNCSAKSPYLWGNSGLEILSSLFSCLVLLNKGVHKENYNFQNTPHRFQLSALSSPTKHRITCGVYASQDATLHRYLFCVVIRGK